MTGLPGPRRAHGPQARRRPAEGSCPHLLADVPLFPDNRPLLLGSLAATLARILRLRLGESCDHSESGRPVHLLCRDPSLMPLDSIWGWLCGCGARGPQGSPLPGAECQAISLESPSSQSWGSVSSGNMPQG